MTERWRNRGAPFTTESGQQIGRGDVFEAPAHGRTVRIRRKKLRRVPDSVQVTVADGEDVDGPEGLYPGVDFGSDRAYEVARDAVPPVTAEELSQTVGTGEGGAILTGDVRRLLEERGQKS